jgi:hypothetical protein
MLKSWSLNLNAEDKTKIIVNKKNSQHIHFPLRVGLHYFAKIFALFREFIGKLPRKYCML